MATCIKCGNAMATTYPHECEGGCVPHGDERGVDLAALAAHDATASDNAAWIDRDLSVIADRIYALKRQRGSDQSSLAAALECIRKAQRHLDGV